MFSCEAFALAGSVGGILDNLYLILATRLLLGVTVAGALIAALTGIGTLPPRQRAQMFGFQSVAGAMLAIGCFPLVGAFAAIGWRWPFALRSEEHTSELQSLMRISYAVVCLNKKKYNINN